VHGHWNLAKERESNTKVKKKFPQNQYFSSNFLFQELIPVVPTTSAAR
jgi:hypothetical protein